MRFRDLSLWSAAFDRAVREALEEHHLGSDSDPGDYRLVAEPCAVHGPRCVCLTYGALRDHIRWSDKDPVQAAQVRLETMLPRSLPPVEQT